MSKATLRCPGCGKGMTPLDLPEAGAEVDVCEHCGGMWIDWFDGEVRKVAAETVRISSPDVKADAERHSNEPVAVGACPHDQRQLVAERYVMTADVEREGSERPSIAFGKPTGAELLRCEECMGSFVTRASAEVLSFLDASDEPPPSRGPHSLKPLPWERFVKVIKSMLGLASVAPAPKK